MRLVFLVPAGVGPADCPVGSVASPDLDRALDGFTDLARAGVMGTSFEDDGPAGTTIKSGACEGFAASLELLLAVARLGFGLLAYFVFSLLRLTSLFRATPT